MQAIRWYSLRYLRVQAAPAPPTRGMADLSVTSAPRTKDFDLFISHNTKDSSYTVYHPVTTVPMRLPQAPTQGLHVIAERAWTFLYRGLCMPARIKRNALYLPTPPCRFSKLSAPL